MTELKPCPFCGGEAYIHIPFSFIDVHHKKECLVRPDTFTFSYETPIEEQIKIWNRRADDDQQ